MGAYPGSKFAFALQDEKTLALARYEWIDTLKDYPFDEKVLMLAFHEAKVIHKDVPSIAEFVEIAKIKAKRLREKDQMEAMEKNRESRLKLEHHVDPEKVLEAKKQFKEILNKLSSRLKTNK